MKQGRAVIKNIFSWAAYTALCAGHNTIEDDLFKMAARAPAAMHNLLPVRIIWNKTTKLFVDLKQNGVPQIVCF